MISPIKLATGIIAVGVTGSAGVGSIVYFTQPKEQAIEELLKSANPKKTLLTTTNKNSGVKAWQKYKDDKGNEKENWTISDWSSEGSKNAFTDSLAGVCALRKKDKVKRVTDEAYINFVNWCTFQEGQ